MQWTLGWKSMCASCTCIYLPCMERCTFRGVMCLPPYMISFYLSERVVVKQRLCAYSELHNCLYVWLRISSEEVSQHHVQQHIKMLCICTDIDMQLNFDLQSKYTASLSQKFRHFMSSLMHEIHGSFK